MSSRRSLLMPSLIPSLTIIALCVLLLGPQGSPPAQSAGLFHTSAEVAVWRERAQRGPYRVAGDAQPNSPGDWTRLLGNANTFVANPAADRYLGTGGTCPTTQQEGPFGGTAWIRGAPLRDAAFAWLITETSSYREAVLGELLVHAQAPGLQWGNDTLFGCVEFTYGHVLLPWNSLMVKYLIAYSFLRSSLAAADQATLDGWFLAYGRRMEANTHQVVASRFPGRKAGDYTVSPSYATCPPDGGDFSEARTLYVGSPYTTCLFHIVWHNGHLFSTLGFGLVGLVVGDATLQMEAKRFFQEHIRYMQWPDGTQGETFRWHPNTPLSGMSYPGTVLILLSLLAEAFARAGDPSLYAYTTTEGYLSSQVTQEGTVKSLLTSILEYQNRVNGTRSIYADSVTEANRLDADMEACCGWSTVNDVLAGAVVSRYYVGAPITANYLRTSGGPPYSNSLNSSCGGGGGTSAAWMSGDAFCLMPGIMLQFAQMEGAGSPYPPGPPVAHARCYRTLVKVEGEHVSSLMQEEPCPEP